MGPDTATAAVTRLQQGNPVLTPAELVACAEARDSPAYDTHSRTAFVRFRKFLPELEQALPGERRLGIDMIEWRVEFLAHARSGEMLIVLLQVPGI
jgi:hypothetical protein